MDGIKKSRKILKCLLIHDGTPIMASGLPAMAAFLRTNGFDCEVLNLYSEKKKNPDATIEIEKTIKEFDLIGISIHWFYQAPSAIDLARRIKNIFHDSFIVLGGFTASFFAKEIISEWDFIDGVIMGDGEIPLLRLCKEISRGNRNFNDVPNLVYRKKNGKIFYPKLPFYFCDNQILNTLDFADLSVLHNYHYYIQTSSWREITDGSHRVPFNIDSTFYLCGGRGCSVQCTYCGGGILSHLVHSMRENGFIFRSPSRIADDAEKAYAFGYRSIHTCFDPQPDGSHWFEFMKEICRRKIRLNFIFESFSIPSEEFLDKLSSSFDNVLLVLSPETAVESLRKKSKGFFYTNRKLEKCLKIAGSKKNIFVQVFFGYFLPDDTKKTIEETLNYIYFLEKNYGSFASFHYYPYSTDPCSPIYMTPEKFKMKCTLKSFKDYLNELKVCNKLSGNLLRHYPAHRKKGFFDIALLRIELEMAMLRKQPQKALQIRQNGSFSDPEKFYWTIARKLAQENQNIFSIEREKLHEYVELFLKLTY